MQPEPVNPTDQQTKLSALQAAERRLELCLAGAGLGIWTYNVATDEFWANDRAKQLHGHAPQEVHTFAEAGANIHPEDRDRAQAAITEAIQTGSKLHIEYRVLLRDGSLHWIASQAEFVPSQGEGVFYGSVQDISVAKHLEEDRKRTQEAMRTFFSNISHEFRRPLTLLLSSIQDALTSLEKDRGDGGDREEITSPSSPPSPPFSSSLKEQLELAYRSAVRLLKLVNTLPDVSRIEAGPIQAVYEPSDLATLTTELTSSFESAIAGLETGADDYLIKPFSAGELIARVETHLQLALLRQEQSANRLKTEFLLTVTHELQAPLALILGWVRLLQSKSFDAKTTAQALATIERNATIEAKLIKDLLDVSGLLSGKVQLKSQFVELVPLLRSVTAQFRAAAEAKQIQLIETLSSVPQGNVVADGDRLKQIIASLLDNAIKFTPKGGHVEIRMSLVTRQQSFVSGQQLLIEEQLKNDQKLTTNYIQIIVADTGIGISPDFLPYVFDRFTQAEVPSRYSPGGVGIGLTIARLLVELHHGTIEVASEGEGRGATFTVRLPLISPTQVNSNSQVQE